MHILTLIPLPPLPRLPSPRIRYTHRISEIRPIPLPSIRLRRIIPRLLLPLLHHSSIPLIIIPTLALWPTLRRLILEEQGVLAYPHEREGGHGLPCHEEPLVPHR